MAQDWDEEKCHTIRILWDLFLWEGVFTNMVPLKGITCGPKQLWDFEDVFIMGYLGVHSFSLFNFLGFILWGLI